MCRGGIMKCIHTVILAVVFTIILFGGPACNSKSGSSESQFKRLPNGGEVNGPRSVENVEKNIALLLPRMQHFYKKYLKTNPELQGTIELIMDIDADGTVNYVNLAKSSLKHPEFEEEVLTAFSIHVFDEWTQGRDKTEVIYPLTFTPEKETKEEENTEQ